MAETTLLQAMKALSSIRSRRKGITRKRMLSHGYSLMTPLHNINGAFDEEIDDIDRIFAGMQIRLENAKVTF